MNTKQKHSPFLLLSTLFLLASQSWAGTYFDHQTIGFSNDERYFAFVQYGEQDGSGFPEAITTIIDTSTSKVVSQAQVILEDDDGKATDNSIAKAVAKSKKNANLARYIERPGKLQGKLLLHRLPTDLSEISKNVFSFHPIAGGASGGYSYELKIAQLTAPVEKDHNDWCYSDEYNKMIAVKLLNEVSGKEHHVYADKRQPKLRTCSFDYRLVKVLTVNTRVVFIFKYLTIGFEGPDHSYMAVGFDTNVLSQ